MQTNGLGPLALSDVARAGAEIAGSSGPVMTFTVDHVQDRPGYLSEVISGSFETPPRQTLSSSANGVGLVILTSKDQVGASSDSPDAPPVRVTSDPEGVSSGKRFVGKARPNPSFLYEGSEPFEGVIVIEDEPRAATYGQGIVFRELATFLSSLSSEGASSPILSLHGPSQAPPHTTARADIRGREDEWSRSSTFAIRFSIAVRSSTADKRIYLADAIGRWCAARGFGFWASDSRGGYRQGLWFGVNTHERLKARAAQPTAADRGGDRQAYCVVPVTIVGPARIGSTSAILSYLTRFPQLGLVATSVTALDDLAFIHLQIAVNHSSRRKLPAKNRELSNLLVNLTANGSQSLSPRHFFSSYGQLASDGAGVLDESSDRVASIEERCGDYQVLAGPVLEVVQEKVRRLPVWAGWRIRDEEHFSEVMLAMNSVWREVGFDPAEDRGSNIEYAISRVTRDSSLRGKAKFSIAESSVPRWAGPGSDAAKASALCVELERRWRSKLRDSAISADVSVGDREFRVGRWSSWV